jgi:signal transduction histidine kinase
MRPSLRTDTLAGVTTTLRALPPWVTDAAIAAGMAAAALVDLFTVSSETIDALDYRPVDSWAIILVLAITLPLVARRTYPTTVLVIVSTAWVLERLANYPSTISVFALLFAFHAVGSELPRHRSRIVGWSGVAALVLFTLAGYLSGYGVGFGTVLVMVVFTTFPLLLGQEIHERRRSQEELAEHAAGLERDREQQAREAVLSERTRIARELHDVVAHQMTVATVQAAAARRLLDRDPARSLEAIAAAEQAGHDGLTEMRRLLGVLRTEDAAQREPQPGLGQLDGLVGQMSGAGLGTKLEIEGEARPLPAGVDLNAYRIVQESLTNALRHGGPAAVATVRLMFAAEAVYLEIEDTGRGITAIGSTGAGHGLIGMRERAALLGGELEAAPLRGGGYRVTARLPYESR